MGRVTPWDFRQATSLERAADDGPPAAALAEELPELAPVEEVLELEPQAARMSAAIFFFQAEDGIRDVRE